MTMALDLCDALVSAQTAVSSLHGRTGDFVSDLLDLLTEQCPRNQDLLRRVVELRPQAAQLNGQAADALADLKGRSRRGRRARTCYSAAGGFEALPPL